MRSSKLAWALAALLLISGLTSHVLGSEDVEDVVEEGEDEYEDVLRAHLIVHKSVSNELIVQGRNVTVTIDVFNAGAASAKEVQVKDALPESATLLDGSLEFTVPRISEGDHVVHTYVMTFTSGGNGLSMPAATVKYLAEEGSSQVGYSTATPVYIMTPVQQITRYALVAGTYVSLGLARTPTDWRNMFIILALVVAVVGGNWAMSSFSTASGNRKRQRALKELEKEE